MAEKNNRTTEKFLFGTLSVLLLVFVFNMYTKKLSSVQMVLGDDDGGSEEQSSPSSDEDEDEDEDEKSGSSSDDEDEKSETETEKKARETAKKQAEREREALKKTGTTSTLQELSQSDDQEGSELTEDEVDDETSETSGSSNGMYKEEEKTVAKLEKEIAEAEKEINEKQGEGVEVTAALARIAEAKIVLEAVKAAFAAGELDKAKELSKQVRKLAHFAKEKDLHDAKEVSEELGKIAKRISQAYGKIALLESVGGDASIFRSTLSGYEGELAAMKAKIAAGGFSVATLEGEQEMLERKVKRLKSSVETAIYALGNTDREYDDDYERETETLVASLKQVAEIEDEDGEVGKSILVVAAEQEKAASRVSDTVADIDERNPVLQTLFGTDRDDLDQLEAEVSANQARITALLKAANAIEDAEVKAILLEQVASLEDETKKLDTFVTAQKERSGVFGWLINLF